MNMDEVKVEEGFKRCSKCGQVKPIGDFNKCKMASDGLQRYCKQCKKDVRKEYYKNHRENELKNNAEWRSNNKEKCKALHAEWNILNKDKISMQRAEYYKNHRENELKKMAEWRSNNKEKWKAYQSEWNSKNPNYYEDYKDPQKNQMGYAKYMVKGYRQMDRDRGFDDSKTISAEWFLQNIAYRPCAHCGLQAIGLIGCNRLDNTKGHTIDNVEPCCLKCNARENIRDQIARGLHWTCKHKKQSFKEFVKEHKKR